MLIEEMSRVMLNTCEIQPGTKILAGISGGPDSLSLLHGLSQLGYIVIAAHYNHQLRPEAGRDASYVQSIAEQMGLLFVSGTSNVAETARSEGQSVEEAARIARYRFLFSQARRLGCMAVAVGHTADDQVETVLMHFLRGAGLAGLQGIQTCGVMPEWDNSIPLVRPLLSIWREEIVAYCDLQGLQPLFDQSNLDTTYFRNRLRHELLPYLAEYNPQIKEVLWRMSQAVAGDYQLLEGLTQSAWETCRLEEGPDFIVLSLSTLHSMKRGLKRNIIRKAIGKMRSGLRDIDFRSIDRAADFIDAPTQTRSMDLSSGLILYASGSRLFLGDQDSSLLLEEWPQLQAGTQLELDVPGRVVLPFGWVLESRWIDKDTLPGMNEWETDPYQTWLDSDCLKLPLQIRTRQPGDRFRPLGMQGHSLKLSDFWINQQLPRPARSGWPLVCSDSKIIWIPGYRPAETCRIDQGTHRAVHLLLKRSEN